MGTEYTKISRHRDTSARKAFPCEKGEKKGAKYGQLKTIRAFMDDLGITFEQAMKAAKIPESDWPEYKKLLEGMGK